MKGIPPALEYHLPEPSAAELEYARYLGQFEVPRKRRRLFARTVDDVARRFRETMEARSWTVGDLAANAHIDLGDAESLVGRGVAPVASIFAAADVLDIEVSALPADSLGA